MSECANCLGDEEDSADVKRLTSDERPISCDEARNLFSKYLGKSLHRADEEKVICHLADCQSCSSAFSEFCSRQIADLKVDQEPRLY